MARHIHSPSSDPVQLRQGLGVRAGAAAWGLGAGGAFEAGQTEAKLTHLLGEVTHELSVGGYVSYRALGAERRRRRWGGELIAEAGATWLAFADGGMIDFDVIDSAWLPYAGAQARVVRAEQVGRVLVVGGAGVAARGHIGRHVIAGAPGEPTRIGGASVSLIFGIGLGF